MRPETLVQSELAGNAADSAAQAGEAAEVDDSELVVAAQDGSSDAFSVLVDRYYNKVYGLIYRISGPTDAEDLTQDVFVRVLKALREFQFKGQASFRTWLYRIAVNTTINELRKRKRRRVREGPSLDQTVETDDGDFAREVADDADRPEDAVERTETRSNVWRALQALKPEYREALVLVDIEGLAYQEAAQILGCALGTLKSRVARARAAFGMQYRRQGTGALT